MRIEEPHHRRKTEDNSIKRLEVQFRDPRTAANLGSTSSKPKLSEMGLSSDEGLCIKTKRREFKISRQPPRQPPRSDLTGTSIAGSNVCESKERQLCMEIAISSERVS
ncbi:hypothetical protein DPMN_140867 [Dreissena polymorpha]|uniref:Uncharacterized protein n=1 Tax=Dreissena polymorpha TaxID=45954 RepID=A0A9D4JHS4_DREPO|nr:hypothetical protein DPMN_140867 [Dreissena polymorpha]